MEELPNILWSFWMAPCKAIVEMSFSMVYDTEAILLAKIGVKIIQVSTYTSKGNAATWIEELDLVKEKRM